LKNQYTTLSLKVLRQVEVPDTQDLPAFFRAHGMYDAAQETFWVVAYDSMRNIRSVVEVARGSYTDVVVHLPTVLTAVLAASTDRFIVVHNHPNGNPEPSQMDLNLTQKIANAASTCGLFFEDHIVIAPPNETYSMVGKGMMVIDPTVRASREAKIRAPRGKAIAFMVHCQ
jgi:DNA repair protein RadC